MNLAEHVREFAVRYSTIHYAFIKHETARQAKHLLFNLMFPYPQEQGVNKLFVFKGVSLLGQ